MRSSGSSLVTARGVVTSAAGPPSVEYEVTEGGGGGRRRQRYLGGIGPSREEQRTGPKSHSTRTEREREMRRRRENQRDIKDPPFYYVRGTIVRPKR